MSARSSTSSSEPVRRGYPIALLAGALLSFALYFAVTLTIDPYGVSPVQVSVAGFNEFKVKRLDIDRAIKPLEVWQKQPRTIFVGTSRIHQSIDTAALEGTGFAPAYNAAIPANELSESVRNIELAFRLSPGIKHVFVELFFYNFARGQARHPPIPLANFASNSASLLLSFSALWASVSTVYANVNGATSTAYVAPAGHWIPRQGFRSALTFDAQRYTDSIIDAHSNIPDMLVQPSAIEALDEIVEICRRNGATLHLLITPTYPWDDYRLLSLGYWPVMEDWLRAMSRYENVVSFSQYNALTEETVGPDMKWWYDPLHVSLSMGAKMLDALLDRNEPSLPENFMRLITPDTVEAVIQERRQGLERWIAQNPSFVEMFETAKAESPKPVMRRK